MRREMFALLFCGSVALTSPLHGITYFWNGANSSWTTSTNWTPNTGVGGPTSSDPTVFGGGGSAQVNLGTAAGLSINGGSYMFFGSLNLAGSANPSLNTSVSGVAFPTVSISGTSTLSVNVGNGLTMNLSGINGGSASVFQLVGGGTLNFSGTNTCGGGTTIMNNSTLSISSAGNIGTSTGTLAFNEGTLSIGADMTLIPSSTTLTGVLNTLNTNSRTVTLNSPITGTGSLIASGNGTLILTAASASTPYNGTTTLNTSTKIQAGIASSLSRLSTYTLTANATLDLANFDNEVASLGSVTTGGTVSLGSATLTLGSASSTFSGIISGTGGITKMSAGTQTFAGSSANTYSGTTRVSNGTLVLSKIAGTHAIVGPVAIDGGTLQLGASDQLGDVDMTIDSGSFDLAGAHTALFRSLSGSGGTVTNSAAGAGTLTLSYSTESITVYSGTIQDGAGTIALTKLGGGQLTLQGNHTHTGATTVSGGTLSVNGTIDSTVGEVSVGVSGILAGIGTIKGAVTVDGTISPGNSSTETLTIGTLIAPQSLTLHPDSTTQIELNYTGTAAKLMVYGATTINEGATLTVVEQVPGVYTAGQQWTILESTGLGDTGGVTGDFTLTPPAFLPSLQVRTEGDFVYLFLQDTTMIGLETSDLSGNNLALANYLNTLLMDPGIFSIVDDLFPLSDGAMNASLSSLSPLRLTSQSFASLNTQFAFSDLLADHFRQRRKIHAATVVPSSSIDFSSLMQRKFEDRELIAYGTPSKGVLTESEPEAPAPKKVHGESYCGWANGFGQFTSETGRDTNPSFDTTTGGVLLGFDFLKSDFAILGGGFAYAHNSLKEAQNAGSSSSNLYVGSLYASLFNEHFFLEGALWSGYNQISNSRNVAIPNTSATVTSKSDAVMLTPHLDVGFSFFLGSLQIEPFVSVDWSYNRASAIDEKNDFPLGMYVNARNFSMLRSEAGLSFYEEIENEWGLFFARETISYVHKKPFSVGQITAAISGQPGYFSMNTFTNTQNAIAPAIELFWKANNGAFVSLMYEGEFGTGYNSNEAVGKIGLFF